MTVPKTKRPTVAILGYGSQGRALALNLRDSGYDPTIGLRSGSKSRRKAGRDRFKPVLTIEKAVASCDILCLAFPDHLHGRVFEKSIAPHLRPGQTLWFLHGLSVHFGFVKPPEAVDIILIAPHAPGLAVREKYLGERDISAFVSVHADASSNARRTAVKLAEAAGFDRKRLVETTFEHEALGDMFGEQAVLCGGLAMLIKHGFDTLVENGIPADNAYLEVAYQLDLIVELVKKFGIEGMLARISVAARLGSVESGPEILDNKARDRMRKTFKKIESGQFARRLNQLTDKDIEQLDRSLKQLSSPALEKAARKFR